ncbi:transglycosylase domain-containing protein, partial [Aliarcobacter butzleri]|nr:transglycosylase domain-containing protein [Aliarcobacter butzleri]
KYDDIPARVIEGLVAIEDTQFFEHWGINPDAISRAMIKNLKAGGFVEGASTLTQQLIKNLTLTREKKLMRKVKEALLAIRLETILTKEEILERYLNHTYFGHGYYGIKTAAKGYFNKDLYELSLKEIAILVGLPRAPSFYDPTRNLQVSLARANQVITRLDTLGWITKEQYEEAINETPTI